MITVLSPTRREQHKELGWQRCQDHLRLEGGKGKAPICVSLDLETCHYVCRMPLSGTFRTAIWYHVTVIERPKKSTKNTVFPLLKSCLRCIPCFYHSVSICIFHLDRQISFKTFSLCISYEYNLNVMVGVRKVDIEPYCSILLANWSRLPSFFVIWPNNVLCVCFLFLVKI